MAGQLLINQITMQSARATDPQLQHWDSKRHILGVDVILNSHFHQTPNAQSPDVGPSHINQSSGYEKIRIVPRARARFRIMNPAQTPTNACKRKWQWKEADPVRTQKRTTVISPEDVEGGEAGTRNVYPLTASSVKGLPAGWKAVEEEAGLKLKEVFVKGRFEMEELDRLEETVARGRIEFRRSSAGYGLARHS
ncbi:hypothetical protein HPP92_024184 [Vanilla planifolia]|uniref:Uncharacterized protein n=1 Tax=Vanilla planifolia TaxID=51239 RepID=A0A835PLX6_VANPL|nr:hypothetical protein HPP92_024184 [Vanilla planifolia]